MIYHITTRKQWNTAIEKNMYECESLYTEGFIHTSTINQVKGVYERYYKDKDDLVVLCIDTSLLSNKLVFEEATNGELYPHVYGTINIDAIEDLKAIEQFVNVII